MKDDLGNRMKGYESVTKNSLMKRSYTIIRIDGKAFHTYTRGMKRPFDDDFIKLMNDTGKYVAENLQGFKFGFVQSDEISLLITDFDKLETELLFNGNIQKICSVSASVATSVFNKLVYEKNVYESLQMLGNMYSIDELIKLNSTEVDSFRKVFLSSLENNFKKQAQFDSRVFQLPTKTEVMNYFIWRQKDAVRNSIISVAQSLYSTKELNGKNCDEMQEMIFQKGINWNNYATSLKRGRTIIRTDEGIMIDNFNVPTFTQDRNYLNSLIPNND